jgi:hypothetical protein
MKYIEPYPEEYKRKFVEDYLAGKVTILGFSRQEGAPMAKTLRRWVKQANAPNEKGDAGHAPLSKQSVVNIHGETVLAIPDMHHPFCHPDALAFLQLVRRTYQPTKIVCLGDEVDFHALSKYPKDPNGLSPGGELSRAIEALIPFYREFPEVLVCESNHTVRGHKLAFQAGIPQAFLAHISAVLNAPDGWKWASSWEIDGVRYFHGDAGRSGQYAHLAYLKAFKQPVVIGHIHSYGGVNFEGNHFAVNSGCLIDEAAYCFAYAKNMPIRPSLGCTIVSGGKSAHFIPMLLDSNQRWIGRL